MPPRRRQSRRKSQLQGALRIGAVLAVLAGVNYYFFFLRSGTSLSDLGRKVAIERAQKTEEGRRQVGDAGPRASAATELRHEGTIRRGDRLQEVLRREGVAAGEVQETVTAVGDVFDPRSLREGQRYALELDDEGRLVRFELVLSAEVQIRVERDGQGALRARKDEQHTEVRVETITGTVSTSLYDAIKAQGEETPLVATLVELFAWDIDFYNETRAGDRFQVVVEKEYLDGAFLRYGRALAAQYEGKVGKFRVFSYDVNGRRGSYDEHGRNIEKSMLRTPLRLARVSSGFDPQRFHPVLHRVKAHNGTDFGAAAGTPVWAASEGTVVAAARHGGGGNTVILDHGGGLQTYYLHLSRFARGLKAGDTVAQKEVIGYVGSTGISTGPHLHFGVKQGGRWIDPQSYKPRRSPGIPAGLLAKYQRHIAPYLASFDKVG